MESRVGGLAEALAGADVLVGVSGPGLVKPEWVASMAKDAIVFAMANPIPEITPEEMPDNVAVVATGRSDYPNKINNVPVFRGVFRGSLDRRARSVDISMKVAAARAIAGIVAVDGVSADHIVRRSSTRGGDLDRHRIVTESLGRDIDDQGFRRAGLVRLTTEQVRTVGPASVTRSGTPSSSARPGGFDTAANGRGQALRPCSPRHATNGISMLARVVLYSATSSWTYGSGLARLG